MENQSVAVVHLVWLPFGTDVFMNFIRSYKHFSAGYAHDLVILFNGVNDKSETKPYHDHLKQEGITYTDFYLANDQDIVAYTKVARSLEHHFVLFLNSYAVLLAHNWLNYFISAITQDKAGLAGASGSWQSYYTSVFLLNTFAWERQQSINENIRKYKLILKAFFYWRFFFKPFPNPHIRTSSFIINRKLLLEVDTGYIKNKFDAYCFESGRKGLSSTLLRKGLKLLVLDKSGNTYEPPEWPASRTFHIGEQEGLLIADNRTREYEQSDLAGRKQFTYLAWGK